MSHTVELLRASHNRQVGVTLWSFRLRYWRAIHAELMTHRVFSRNAGSSRAIPVRKVLAQVWNDPAGPLHWGSNRPGMQAGAELTGWRLRLAKAVWKWAGRAACVFAWGAMKLGLHKQVANRLLEPWQFINVVVSSTEWQNFFDLRCHPDAQPEMQALASDILSTMLQAVEFDQVDILAPGEWHMIYLSDDERATLDIETLLKLSTARSARVSYEPFDGNADPVKEIDRHDKLVASEPIHASPTEHQAQALPWARDDGARNFTGFKQYRAFVEEKLHGQPDAA
jgi:hypothetical protein